MFQKVTRQLCRYERIIKILLLCFLWVLGFTVGILMAFNSSTEGQRYLNSAIVLSPSVLGAVIIVLPVVICTAGISTDMILINCAVVLIESFLRGFLGYLVYLSYGDGAWILRTVLFFSSTFCDVLMWWLLFNHYFGGKVSLIKNFGVSFVASFLVIMVDRLLISPFLILLSMYI